MAEVVTSPRSGKGKVENLRSVVSSAVETPDLVIAGQNDVEARKRLSIALGLDPEALYSEEAWEKKSLSPNKSRVQSLAIGNLMTGDDDDQDAQEDEQITLKALGLSPDDNIIAGQEAWEVKSALPVETDCSDASNISWEQNESETSVKKTRAHSVAFSNLNNSPEIHNKKESSPKMLGLAEEDGENDVSLRNLGLVDDAGDGLEAWEKKAIASKGDEEDIRLQKKSISILKLTTEDEELPEAWEIKAETEDCDSKRNQSILAEGLGLSAEELSKMEQSSLV